MSHQSPTLPQVFGSYGGQAGRGGKGNSRESMNMVTPAMQLASKIPDVHVQLWASAILKDLYRLCADPRENEAFQMHCNFSQMLLKDHFQASQMPEHNLIQWTEGSFPLLVDPTPSST
uniref:Cohesin loading complex subunit SCC4 homolog n=1 Tax=Timema tahoe TaxID=61484 RepID=A0A7R9IK59_9NEOP|nr:unnamed protein product [Timema tahoe]